ncbi:MAG: hypothetical protein FWD59_06435 [Micrococcales bacterium]|nr:hypothetical protein [Micrococcales bacterium]
MAMTLRLSEQDTFRLREQARDEGRSMQEVALGAVRGYLDDAKRTVSLDLAIEDLLTRYPETLRRLGE